MVLLEASSTESCSSLQVWPVESSVCSQRSSIACKMDKDIAYCKRFSLPGIFGSTWQVNGKNPNVTLKTIGYYVGAAKSGSLGKVKRFVCLTI